MKNNPIMMLSCETSKSSWAPVYVLRELHFRDGWEGTTSRSNTVFEVFEIVHPRWHVHSVLHRQLRFSALDLKETTHTDLGLNACTENLRAVGVLLSSCIVKIAIQTEIVGKQRIAYAQKKNRISLWRRNKPPLLFQIMAMHNLKSTNSLTKKNGRIQTFRRVFSFRAPGPGTAFSSTMLRVQSGAMAASRRSSWCENSVWFGGRRPLSMVATVIALSFSN